MKVIKAIEGLDTLPTLLDVQLAHVKALTVEAQKQWLGLKRVGGAREDHAATLLATMKPYLRNLAKTAGDCAAQIEEWEKNPFRG